MLSIYKNEKPKGVICQLGGQSPLNIAAEFETAGVNTVEAEAIADETGDINV